MSVFALGLVIHAHNLKVASFILMLPIIEYTDSIVSESQILTGLE